LELLAFNPRVAASDWYYQCSHHEKMGGPVFIYKSDGKEVVFTDNATNTHVLQDATTGEFVVVASGGEEHPHRTISDAVRHLGLEITPRFNVGTSIVGSDIGVTVAIISRNGEDEYDDHTPAVLLRDNGKLACEHVHTVADLCQWLTRDKPHDSTQMCPDKCHV
jgi:hypothetical protein